jgi:5-methylcytosine-specific restriction endonuclease McrA
MGTPRKYTPEILAPLVASSTTFAEVCRKLGLKGEGSMNNHIAAKIREFGLDTSHFTGKRTGGLRRGAQCPHTIPTELLLVRHRKPTRTGGTTLKRALDTLGVSRACAECGLDGEWNGKPLVTQIDHINGDHRDDRPENLRYLCPNCHSQTDTFTGRNNRKRSRGESVDTPASNPGGESHEGSTPSESIRSATPPGGGSRL